MLDVVIKSTPLHDPNFQHIELKYECSILGCVVAANLRFSAARIKYLLWPTHPRRAYAAPEFVVETARGFTAIHVAVLADEILHQPEERDPQVAKEILGLLLEKFESAEEPNAQTGG